MFRPPVRRCLPGACEPPGESTRADAEPDPSSSTKSKKASSGAASERRGVSDMDAGTGTGKNKGKGRGRSLGLGLGQAGRGGAESGWEEGEPTDFVYTGFFPHEVCFFCFCFASDIVSRLRGVDVSHADSLVCRTRIFFLFYERISYALLLKLSRNCRGVGERGGGQGVVALLAKSCLFSLPFFFSLHQSFSVRWTIDATGNSCFMRPPVQSPASDPSRAKQFDHKTVESGALSVVVCWLGCLLLECVWQLTLQCFTRSL